MIDRQTVAKIHDAIKIEDVVGDFVSLRKRGANLIGLCPFHNEKTGSFNVSPARGIFKCFGCGEGGDAVRFIMKHEHLNYPDALRFLAKKYNIEIVEKELTSEEQALISDREKMLSVNDFALLHFINNLEIDEGRAIGKSYFYERGFNDATIKKFGLGYSLNSVDMLCRESRKRGFDDEYLIKTGLAYKTDRGDLIDRFRGRVMFPIHSLSGKVVGFGGRVLGKSDKVAKYVNSPESEIYNKSNELYGIFFAKNQIVKQERCFLVEGYTDVISMHQCGIENVVSSSGTSLTEGQIKLIYRFTKNITVIYDGDAAGIKASIRGIDMLLAYGMNIKVVLLPEGEDPDSFARSNSANDFSAYIENNQVDFIDFKIKILQEDANNDPIKKAAIATEIIKSLSTIPDQIVRATYVKESAIRLDVSESLIYGEINKILRKKHEEEAKKTTYRQGVVSQEVNSQEAQTETKKLLETKNVLYKHEKEIIRFLIQDGQTPLLEADNEKGFINVGEYIYQTLSDNDLRITTPLFQQIIDEFYEHTNDEVFDCESYFKHHINGEISSLAIAFLAEKYLANSRAGRNGGREEIELPEIVEGDEKSLLFYNLAKLRKEKEMEKRRLEEQEAVRQLNNALNIVILEFVNAKYNQELSGLLKQLGQNPAETHLENYIESINKRYTLVNQTLKGRVIVKIH